MMYAVVMSTLLLLTLLAFATVPPHTTTCGAPKVGVHVIGLPTRYAAVGGQRQTVTVCYADDWLTGRRTLVTRDVDSLVARVVGHDLAAAPGSLVHLEGARMSVWEDPDSRDLYISAERAHARTLVGGSGLHRDLLPPRQRWSS